MAIQIERGAPEYKNVEAFISFLFDDDRNYFYPGEAQEVARQTGKNIREIMGILGTWGFKIQVDEPNKGIRGVSSNPNGTHPFQSNPTYTMSGTSNITGFAGRSGS